jgi:hypothetical protein
MKRNYLLKTTFSGWKNDRKLFNGYAKTRTGLRCSNKNHSYKHNEQINKQNIDNSECFGLKYVKIYPEITSQ